DSRATHADRDERLFSAPTPDRPGKLVADMARLAEDIEGDARYRGVADRTTKLAVADFVSAGNPEHEFAGQVGLPVARTLEIVAALDRADHIGKAIATRKDRGVAHAHQRLVAERIRTGVSGWLGP